MRDMRNNDEIISLVAKIMEQNNLSTSELARRLNIAKSSVSRYLNRTSQFPLNKVNDFAHALNVTPEYLLGVEENKQNTLAAHLDGDFTEEELQEILEYAEFVKQKHRNK